MFPENITTVPITGRLLAGTVDGPRPTTQRQAVRARFLVEFTPEVTKIPAPSASGGPTTFYRGGGLPFAPVKGVVDSRGYLCTPDPDNHAVPMFEGVRLIATDDEALAVKDWTWRVNITTLEGKPVESYSIAVPAAAAVNGLDLTNLAPVPSTPGYGIPQAEAAAAMAAQNSTIAVQSVVRAEATVVAVAEKAIATGAVVGDDLILTRENGVTVNAGHVRGERGEPGPNTIPTDEAVATNLTTPGTATSEAVSSLIVGQLTSPDTASRIALDGVYAPQGLASTVAGMQNQMNSLMGSAASIEELTETVRIGEVGGTAISSNSVNPIWVAPFPCKVVTLTLVFQSYTRTIDAANYVEIGMRRQRGAASDFIVGKRSSSEAIAPLTPWRLNGATFNATNQVLDEGDILTLNILFGGSPGAIPMPLLATFRYLPL